MVFDLKLESTITYAVKAKQYKKAYRDFIDLTLGEPDFKTPQPIIDALNDALRKGYTRYAPAQGYEELRRAIVQLEEKRLGVSLSPSQILVTPGAKTAVFLAFLLATLSRECRNVVITDPYYYQYVNLARMFGLQVRLSKLITTSDGGFQLDVADFIEKIDKQTCLAIVNTPHNPAASKIKLNEFEEIADRAKKFNVLLVSDEVYADYVFEGKHVSLLHVSGWEDVGVYVNSFSKTFAMTGWRLGYIVASPKLVSLLRSFAANIYTSPTSFVQIAAVKAVEIYDDVRRMILETFHERKSLVEELSQQTFGLRPARLEGGMFAFIMLSKEVLSKVESSDQYADYLLEKAHIALTPGTIFSKAYGRQALRLSLAAHTKTIREAFRRLEEANKVLLES